MVLGSERLRMLISMERRELRMVDDARERGPVADGQSRDLGRAVEEA